MTVVTAMEMYERLKSTGFKKISEKRVTGEEYEDWVRERFIKFTTSDTFNIIDKYQYRIDCGDLNLNYIHNIEIKTKFQEKTYSNFLNKFIYNNEINSLNIDQYYLKLNNISKCYQERIEINNVRNVSNELGVWNMDIRFKDADDTSYSIQDNSKKRFNGAHVEELQKWTNIQQLVAC